MDFYGENTQPAYSDNNKTDDRLIFRSNPLSLDIPDNELIFNINQKIKKSQEQISN